MPHKETFFKHIPSGITIYTKASHPQQMQDLIEDKVITISSPVDQKISSFELDNIIVEEKFHLELLQLIDSASHSDEIICFYFQTTDFCSAHFTRRQKQTLKKLYELVASKNNITIYFYFEDRESNLRFLMNWFKNPDPSIKQLQHDIFLLGRLNYTIHSIKHQNNEALEKQHQTLLPAILWTLLASYLLLRFFKFLFFYPAVLSLWALPGVLTQDMTKVCYPMLYIIAFGAWGFHFLFADLNFLPSCGFLIDTPEKINLKEKFITDQVLDPILQKIAVIARLTPIKKINFSTNYITIEGLKKIFTFCKDTLKRSQENLEWRRHYNAQFLQNFQNRSYEDHLHESKQAITTIKLSNNCIQTDNKNDFLPIGELGDYEFNLEKNYLSKVETHGRLHNLRFSSSTGLYRKSHQIDQLFLMREKKIRYIDPAASVIYVARNTWETADNEHVMLYIYSCKGGQRFLERAHLTSPSRDSSRRFFAVLFRKQILRVAYEPNQNAIQIMDRFENYNFESFVINEQQLKKLRASIQKDEQENRADPNKFKGYTCLKWVKEKLAEINLALPQSFLAVLPSLILRGAH